MGGLYSKALFYRTQEELLNVDGNNGGITFEEDSGIPLEEQREILKQIENVVGQNKMTITKETMTLHPQKKGILFPFLNFVLTVFISVGIFIILQQTFAQRVGEAILPASWDAPNTESVLSRVRKEAQQNLATKENEISNINNQLKSLSEEKDKLQDSMKENIEKKERELALTMEQKIKEEKERLQKQGIALVDIEAKMEELRKSEKDKNDQLIASYRAEEDEKRKIEEKKLAQQMISFQNSLQTAKTDMEKLKADAAESDRQWQQKLKEQEEEQKKKTQDLIKAEDTIKKLSEQRANEQMINDQIDGFYNTIILNISESNLTAAKINIQKMKEYFNKPEIMTLPGIIEKREKNLFLVNALDQMILNEEAKKNIDYASLYQKAEIVSSINTKVQEADNLFKKNEKEKAKILYEEALSLFPDIKASYVKLLEFNEAEKTALFRDSVNKGDEFYKNKEYTKAVASYKSAIKLIPANAQSLDLLVNNIVETGYQLKGDTVEKDKEDKNAQQTISQANTFYDNKAYVDAIDKYLEVLSKYPRSSQVDAARTGIKKSFERITEVQTTSDQEKNKILTELEANLKKEQENNAQLNTSIQEYKLTIKENSNTIKKLNTTLKEKEDMLTNRETSLSGNTNTIKEQAALLTEKNNEIIRFKTLENTLRTTISTLQNEKKAAEDKLALTGTKNTAAETTKSTTTEISPEVLKDIETYKALQEQINQLKVRYANYTMKEDTALISSGSMGYLSTRPVLGEILSSELMSGILPDLYKRIKSYEDALVDDALKAGNDQAMEKLLEIIDEFYSLEKNQSKPDFWKAKKQEYRDNSLFLEVLDEMQAALK